MAQKITFSFLYANECLKQLAKKCDQIFLVKLFINHLVTSQVYLSHVILYVWNMTSHGHIVFNVCSYLLHVQSVKSPYHSTMHAAYDTSIQYEHVSK